MPDLAEEIGAYAQSLAEMAAESWSMAACSAVESGCSEAATRCWRRSPPSRRTAR